MKRMFFILLISVLLVISSGTLCFAADLTWQENLEVCYDGKTVESRTDMETALSNLKAGDTMTFNIKLDNSADGEMVWWLNSRLLDNIRYSTSKSGGAMTYEVMYGGKLLYTNMEGPDKEYSLPEAEGMPGYLLLDSLNGGSSGILMIKAALKDGFSGRVSDYAADMNLSFALESQAVKSAVSPAPQETQGMNQGIIYAAMAAVMAGLFLMEKRSVKKGGTE